MPAKHIQFNPDSKRDRQIFDDYLGNHIDQVVVSASGNFEKDWFTDPNFFSKKRLGQFVPTSPLTIYHERWENTHGNMRYFPVATPTSWRQASGVMGGSSLFIPLPSYLARYADVAAILEGLCSPRLLEKIKNQKVNLAQAFQESGQTAKLVADTATRLAKSVTLLKKGNVLGALNVLGHGKPPPRIQRHLKVQSKNPNVAQRVSSQWLEIQYGWKPLLSDVYGAAELCAQRTADVRLQKVSHTLHIKAQNTVLHGGVNDLPYLTDFATAEYRFKMSVQFQVESDVERHMSSIGVSNPETLAWELIPFSFVADWFLPIGGYLSNIDAKAGLILVNATVSCKMQQTANREARSGVTTGSTPWSFTGEATNFIEHREEVRYRTIWPHNNLPEFKNPLSFTHMANALALLIVAFR